VNVNISAVKLSGVLAAGLRKNFFNPAKVLFPLLMMKLREKKTLLIDETRVSPFILQIVD
jgi:cytoskeleton-associated protein 5